MSLETELKNLNSELSKEEEDIVDSIINELNDGNQPSYEKGAPPPPQQQQQQPPQQQQQQPQQQPQQNIPEEILRQIPPEAPPHIQQQIIAHLMNGGSIPRKDIEPEDMLDKIKKDIKSPIIVSLLYLVLSSPQVNELIKSLNIGFILEESGELNYYALIIKALIVGILYYLLNKYVNV
jgi:hypothetical protein